MATVLDWLHQSLPRFLPNGTELLEAQGHAQPLATGVSDQPTLEFMTSCCRFLRNAAPGEPDAAAAAVSHPASLLLLRSAASPRLLQGGGDAWDACVSLYIRVALQALCNLLSAGGCEGEAADALWAAGMSDAFRAVLTTAAMRQDDALAGNCVAFAFALLRAECLAAPPSPVPRLTALVRFACPVQRATHLLTASPPFPLCPGQCARCAEAAVFQRTAACRVNRNEG